MVLCNLYPTFGLITVINDGQHSKLTEKCEIMGLVPADVIFRSKC